MRLNQLLRTGEEEECAKNLSERRILKDAKNERETIHFKDFKITSELRFFRNPA
jgi:hypothetical protein